ncbi:MAG: isochorismate synthase [Chloroflexota bacterium]
MSIEFDDENIPQPQVLLSVTIPADSLDVYSFLRHGRGGARCLWRDENITLAGIGKAHEIFGWGKRRFREIESQATDLFSTAVLHPPKDAVCPVEPKLFGGFSFTAEFIPDVAWSSFYPAHFILPHYQLTQTESGSWITINIMVMSAAEADELASDMVDILQSRLDEWLSRNPEPFHYPNLQEIAYPMSKDQWTSMLRKAINQMKVGDMQKVVLSRVSEVNLDGPAGITRLLAWLDDHYAECNRFLFEPVPFHAFYGATPETLIETNGRQFDTMGLAGSAPRGNTAEADAEFGNGLLNDPKNQHEHKLVVDSIIERLEPITVELNVAKQTELMKLGNIQHLYTPITGKFKEAPGIIPLLERLHPTPALGGAPRGKAMAFIEADEPVTRGWYGAPVGFLNPNLDGKFGVAIRSAVAQWDRVWAYAGAGIVADSDPASEWDETAIKFRPMLNALGVDSSS